MYLEAYQRDREALLAAQTALIDEAHLLSERLHADVVTHRWHRVNDTSARLNDVANLIRRAQARLDALPGED